MTLDARSKHLRSLIVRGLAGGNCGHIGAAMSLVEILRVLYDDVMRYDPANPKWPDRDRCILSKGHGCLALYAILADKGFFPPEELDLFRRRGGILGGHPDAKVPGVEASTGALGHGLSIGVGMALAARIHASRNPQQRPSRIFVIMGDGEIQEGSVWEAAMCAAKHELSNLTVIVDYNKLQSAGRVDDICGLEPLYEKWEAFGFWTVQVDGHDLKELITELPIRAESISASCPRAIICHTVKGKGIPFVENDPAWHHRAQLTPETVVALREAVAA